jgi:uncharacterized protein YbjT (DUF2867 family)
MATSFSTASALVFGATGYTGRAVVAALRAHGVATVAHVRPGSASAVDWRSRFEALGAVVDDTPWDAAAIAATIAARRPTHLFALLGTTRRRAAREGIADPYESVDYGLTKMVLDGAVGAGHLPRFVYLSALGVRGDTTNPYLAARARIEQALQASRLPFLIVRPALITGSDRAESRPAERVAALVIGAALGALAAIGIRRPRERFGTLTGTQLAEGMTVLALAARDARLVADVAAIRGAIPKELR